MMIERTLEKITLFSPLGIRFWDPAFDRPVNDGLLVTLRPALSGRPTLAARLTAGGVYAFHNIPGLHPIEYPLAEGATPLASPPSGEASPPDPQSYVIEIVDRRGRFMPVALQETLPLPYLGLYRIPPPSSPPETSPPEGSSPDFYLFSAPARRTEPGLAVIRAQLVDRSSATPAVNALLSVSLAGGETWFGLSDEQGRVVVIFSYPRFTATLDTSPSGGPPLQAQTWPLTIGLRYAPSDLLTLSTVGRADLRSVLAQAGGLIYPTDSPPGAGQTTWTVDLTYGQALVLRTGNLSTLHVSALGSPF